MRQFYTHPNQVAHLMAMMLRHIEESPDYERITSSWVDVALQYLAEKQAMYQGSSYVEQIEKNAVYLLECSTVFVSTIAEYLCIGKPVLGESHIPFFVRSLRQQGLEMAEWQLAFIRTGCNGCPVHSRHGIWESLRTMRRTASKESYIEELEFTYIYHQMMFMISQTFLEAFLKSSRLAGSASTLAIDTLYATVEKQVRFRVALWSGLVRPEVQRLAKPTWRDVWGDRFDRIAATRQPGSERIDYTESEEQIDLNELAREWGYQDWEDFEETLPD